MPDLNVDITDFDFGDEYSQIVVSSLSFIEKSGLRMKELDGRGSDPESNLTITDARIELERSSLDLMKLEFQLDTRSARLALFLRPGCNNIMN